MAYRHNDNLHKHKVQAHRFRKVTFFFVTAVVLITLVIGIDWLIGRFSDSNTTVSRENNSLVKSANVSVYRTEFFQFQAPESWVAVANESHNNNFVYVNNNGAIITQKLTVIVNQPERSKDADYKITRVLPATLDKDGKLNPQDKVSGHCTESWPENLRRNPARIIHANVSFVCAPDSQQYNVVVGTPEGSESYKVTLSDGREATLLIIFSDLTAYPTPGEIYSIISSFSTL